MYEIPLSEPEISGNEWKLIRECLDSGWVSSVGNSINRFENLVKKYIGVKYAVALINGTSALHISLLVSGVRPDDEVIVPTLTFIAPVNVIRYCCAYPVFMDCDAKTLCMDVEKLKEFINNKCIVKDDGFTYNLSSGRRIKAIIPVHVFGHPTDMDRLAIIARKYNISLIEDATESLGSEYRGKKTGSIGDIGCFSFNGNKIITTGGGGMIVTDDEFTASKARHLSTQAKSDSFEYDHDEIGYNYRLTNIQAAMGIAQMERLEEFIERKRKNAFLYIELLSRIEYLFFFQERQWATSNYWFYVIRVAKEHKQPLIEHLISKKIQVRPIWKLIHTLPMYADSLSFSINEAFRAYESCINLPCSVNLTEKEIRYISDSIAEYFQNS